MVGDLKRRGLSPVVATALLIFLVILLGILIFLWSRGFFSEQVEKFGKPIDSLCSSVSFQMDWINGTDDGARSQGYDTLEVLNTGEVNIHSFEIKKHYGGDSETMILDLKVPAGKIARGEAYMRIEGSAKVPEVVEVFPILSGMIKGKSSRKTVSCSKVGQGTFLTWD